MYLMTLKCCLFFCLLSHNTFQCCLTTTTAGIAPNMMLSKVCSDRNKPNGQYQLVSTREAVMEFVQDLPVRKVQCTLFVFFKKTKILNYVLECVYVFLNKMLFSCFRFVELGRSVRRCWMHWILPPVPILARRWHCCRCYFQRPPGIILPRFHWDWAPHM